MNITAIIPARIGSKRIPMKNLEKIGPYTLVERATGVAVESERITHVVALVDDVRLIPWQNIRECIEYLIRPPETATDEAQIEDAVKWYLKVSGDKPDYIVLLQPTSPLRISDDIDAAIEHIEKTGSDSLVSGYYRSDLYWTCYADSNINWVPNFEPDKRIRSQDMSPVFVENGAIYIFKPSVLEKHNSRVGDRVAFYAMPRIRSFEIDEPEDLELVRAIHESDCW